ncbi:hypothetical protein EMIT0347P_40498 [Pseudomonas sp. IT-347P]
MSARCSVSCLPVGVAPEEEAALAVAVVLAAVVEAGASAAAGAVSAAVVRPAAGDIRRTMSRHFSTWHY